MRTLRTTALAAFALMLAAPVLAQAQTPSSIDLRPQGATSLGSAGAQSTEADDYGACNRSRGDDRQHVAVFDHRHQHCHEGATGRAPTDRLGSR